MGMPGTLPYYTVAMVQALPDDGNRHEAVHGELLVTPGPTWSHQRLVGRLFVKLASYVARHGLGEVFMAPADLVHGPTSLVQPDVIVLPFGVRDHGPEELARAMLLVEVLSPSSAGHDRFAKRRLYQEAGVPAYWIVDGEARAMEVWTPDAVFPQVEHERVLWYPSGAEEPFTLDCAELFRAPPV